MITIRTDVVDRDTLSPFEQDMIYNGLDCCVTHDVFANIHPQLDDLTEQTYDFSRALQGPVLEMRLRGVLVDQVRRSQVVGEICEQIDFLETRLETIVREGLNLSEFNWRSGPHLQQLFYRTLGINPIMKQGRPTIDRAAREKLQSNPNATQLIRHINALTELGDKLSVLRTAIDQDSRIRTSYNIAGTSTGRFSSSLSEFGTGGNLQNVEESLRSIFIADPGYKFAKFDAKSGESFCVGAIEWNRFGDGTYLDACESGDPHTSVARIVWPHLEWTNVSSRDKEIAEQRFYRHHSYRDMCKKIGHGSNYGGSPPALAEQTKLPTHLIAEFQTKYFTAFPAHRRWHQDVDDRLRRLGHLISLTNRRRWFFGRRSDPSVFREALAFDPQGSLADMVNLAMLKLWRMNIAAIVMQDHDAITFMYKEEDEERIIPILLHELVVPIPLAQNRTLRIPYDVEVGWNKGKYKPVSNPDGLLAYHGHDARKRQPIRTLTDMVITKQLAGAR